MLLRLIALGALGYAGYKYLAKDSETSAPATSSGHPDIGLAGGPLSSQATLQHTADDPPPTFV